MLREFFAVLWILLMIVAPVGLFIWLANIGSLNLVVLFFFVLWLAGGVSGVFIGRDVMD